MEEQLIGMLKNKAPEFPQAAKSSGKHGKLKIKLKVDKMGNVFIFRYS